MRDKSKATFQSTNQGNFTDYVKFRLTTKVKCFKISVIYLLFRGVWVTT